MNKVYERINWENYPSIHTPINEKNLNKLDFAADALDNRIINLDTAKVDKSSIQTNVADWTMDSDTGIITITKVNGEKVIFDLNIEKIPIEFKLTPEGILIMITDDGTQFKADIGSMIPILTFNSSSEIQVTVTGTGINKVYSFSIIKNSITEDKLEANYLADIKTEVAKAQSSSKTATDAATTATNMANNAKSYSENAAASKMSAETAASISETNSQQASTSANNAAKSEANAKLYMNDALNSSLDAETSKNQSDLNAEAASQAATLAKSYAVGGTNTRTDEDTHNAKYYYEQLKVNQPVIIYNDLTHTNGANNDKTAADITHAGFSAGMIRGAQYSPLNKTAWFHILNMNWDKVKYPEMWVSQIALDVQESTGMYYRTTNDKAQIHTKNWVRVLDSENYKEFLGETSNELSMSMPNCVIVLPNSTNYITSSNKNDIQNWIRTIATECKVYYYADNIDDDTDDLNSSITVPIRTVYNNNKSDMQTATDFFIGVPIYKIAYIDGNLEGHWDAYSNCILDIFNIFKTNSVHSIKPRVHIIGILENIYYPNMSQKDIIQLANFKYQMSRYRLSITKDPILTFDIFNCMRDTLFSYILTSYAYSIYNNLPLTVMDTPLIVSGYEDLTFPGYIELSADKFRSSPFHIIYSMSPNKIKLAIFNNGNVWVKIDKGTNGRILYEGIDMLPEYFSPIRIPLGEIYLKGRVNPISYNANLVLHSDFAVIEYVPQGAINSTTYILSDPGYYNLGSFLATLEVEIDTTI
jgi:hypothetical protein